MRSLWRVTYRQLDKTFILNFGRKGELKDQIKGLERSIKTSEKELDAAEKAEDKSEKAVDKPEAAADRARETADKIREDGQKASERASADAVKQGEKILKDVRASLPPSPHDRH